MLELLIILAVLVGVLFIGHHRYIIRWDSGKQETVTVSFFKTENMKIVTPNVPYMVNRRAKSTILTVSNDAKYFQIQIGKERYKVF
jgi:hypothetical protein